MAQESNRPHSPLISKVQTERKQGHSTRQQLFLDLEQHLKRPVVTFFTSFRYPVAIGDEDVDMLEGMLRSLDLTNGVTLMVNSPGGSGLAAERIINLLRTYSGTDKYSVIVPAKAKSAATMVCLGSSKIIMGPTSELGPVDPQQVFGNKMVSVHHIIDSYHQLFKRAVETQGNVEPYLQQLTHYDATEISHLEAERDLATDMAVRCLQTGMMQHLSTEEIKEKLQVFLSPSHTKMHGRPIYHEEATGCGLNIEVQDQHSDLWESVYELYVRSNDFVSNSAAKAIETADGSAAVRAPSVDGG